MLCHYEVLGVERDADAAGLKKAYRRKALQLHPDKNQGNEADATKQFQLVQAAYAVLNDPQERAWYDSHREAILRGAEGGEYNEGINLLVYFSSSAYDGFSDAEPESFWNVYAAVFLEVMQDETNAAGKALSLPEFGNSVTPHEVVADFYSHWEVFVTQRTFHSVDKWDLREAPNRRIRRLMEKENEKERRAARREYSSHVKALVKFVKRRDKRMIRRTLELKEQAAAKEAQRQAEQAQKDAEAREHRQAVLAAAKEQQAQDSTFHKEMEALESWADDFYGDEDERAEDGMYCVACNKAFKSEKQWENHQRSKKHLKAVAELRAELEAEDADFLAAEHNDNDDIDDNDDGSDLDSLEIEEPELLEGDAVEQASLSEDDGSEEEGVSLEDQATMAALWQSKTRTDHDRQGKHVDGNMTTEASLDPHNASSSSVSLREDDADHTDDEDDLLAAMSRLAVKRQDHHIEATVSTQNSVLETEDAVEAPPRPEQDGIDESVETQLETGDKPDADKPGADELDGQAVPEQQGKRKGKKKGRRAKKQSGPSGTGDSREATEEHLCNVCSTLFPTRNKLFQHIKATGHALRVDGKASVVAQLAQDTLEEDPWADDHPKRRKGRKGRRK
eukprot:m.166798 g.166798  ORF g.166798 m.166798 type:complete len:620 (+) comp16631_c0_seq4:2735-4594(+)